MFRFGVGGGWAWRWLLGAFVAALLAAIPVPARAAEPLPCAALEAVSGVIAADFGAAIAIDPATNAGSGVLVLENLTEQRFCELTLKAERFVSTLTRQAMDSEVTVLVPGATPSDGAPFELAPKQRIEVKLTAARVWDAGEATAAVRLGRFTLGTLRAQRLRVPFAIELGNAGTEASPLHGERGKPLLFQVKNADALNYALAWELILDGESVAEQLGKQGCDSQPVTLGASSSGFLRVCLPERSFPGAPGSWFKERVRHGVLKLSHAADAGAQAAPASKVFPVVVALGVGSVGWRTARCLLLTLVVLMLGGLCSLFLTHAIPNAFQRLALRAKLEPLAARTKALSDHLPAQLQVELRVTRLSISQRLENEWAWYPGTAEVLAAVAREVQVLELRLALIDRVDDLLRRIELMGPDGPPDALRQQRRALLTALRPLEGLTPRAAELKTAEDNIGAVEAELGRIEAEDPILRSALLAEASSFMNQYFEPAWRELPAAEPWVEKLRASTEGFVREARERLAKGEDRADENLAALDTTFTKVKLIVDYVRVCRRATAEQRVRFDEAALGDQDAQLGQPISQRERFFECLSGSGSRTLDQARLVLRQAEQGIFVKQIVEQLELGKFAIEVDPQYALVYDPIAFRFVFLEDKFNDAEARKKLDCEWTFAHGSDRRVERVWDAFQFFSSPGRCDVQVTVRRGTTVFYSNQTSAHPAPCSVTIRTRKDRVRSERAALELIQLGVALAVTMGALATGARDQLERLDLLAGVAAIFALGFGADVVKNIVSRRVPPVTSSGG